MPKQQSSEAGRTTTRRLLAISIAVATAWTIHLGRAGAADRNDEPTGSRSLVGTQLTYRVRYKSEGYTELRAAEGVAPGSDAPRHDLLGSLEGVEILTILSHDRTGHRASVRFENLVVNIQVDSKSQPEREREVVENLGHPAAIYFDAQSRIIRLEVPREYSAMASNFVKAVVSLQQYASPLRPGRRATAWDMKETGANGQYMAHYQVARISGPLLRITKTLARISGDRAGESPDSATLVQVVPQGKIEIDVNADQDTVQDLDGVSREDMLVQGHVLASQNTSVTAHILSSVRLSEGDLAATTRMLTVPRLAANALTHPKRELTSDQERAIQQRVLGTESSQSMLAALSEIDNVAASRNRKMNVYLKLKALVYLQPEVAKTLGNRLSDADPTSSSTEMIITALSAVGSSQAQDALCTAIRSRKDDSHELNGLVPVLGTLHEPTERVVALLYDLSHSSSSGVRSMALLALGGAAKNLAQKSTKRANGIVNTLAAGLSISSAVGDRSTLLLALGNSGTKRAEDILLSTKTDQSPELRRTVVAALADFQSPRSVHALCGSLNVDEDIQVRAAAAQALAPHIRVSAAKDTLLRAAQQDSAESVRLASMFALTDLIPRDENVREVIGALAHDDSSATVRKQAASLLQKGKSPQL